VLALAVLLLVFPPVRHVLARGWSVLHRVWVAERAERARAAMVAQYARRYGISTETADAVERAARTEGVDVDLAFRLVRIESGFRSDAVSHAGALGMTQLMPVTAGDLQPGITREQLMDRDTNLRLGFRYLRTLLRVYGGDREMALHAYNRGIGTVARIRADGGDPDNGYAGRVLGPDGASPVGADTLAPVPAVVDGPAHEIGPSTVPAGT
jgi:soluble lytic murein transglycosylase-like protein